MLTAPKLPLPARAINRGQRLASRLGFLQLRLSEEDLLDRARTAAGLSDFGDDSFRGGLRVLVDALEGEANLTAIGRFGVRAQITALLQNRLRIHDWTRRHPEVLRGEVRQPIFLVGMPRTGTSILHELLAQDPAIRTPLTWEVDDSVPPPQASTYETDPRIERTHENLQRTEHLISDFCRMHRMDARLPQECVQITAMEFTSMVFQPTFRVPSYAAWLHEVADLAPAYALHRRTLQLLQSRCQRERWALKSPAHQWHLKELLSEYPDAFLVYTHRDPLRVLSSLTSLATTLRAMSSDRIDPHEIACEWSFWNARALAGSVEARDSGLIDASRVIDIHFDEFMSDPFASIRRVYEKCGLDYTPIADARMRAYLATHSDDEHGKHTHQFSDTGLDRDEEMAKVRRYQEYFDIPSEVK